MHATNNRPYRIGIDARFFRSATGGLGRYTQELIRHLAAIDQINEYVIFLTPADVPEWRLQQPNFRTVVVPVVHYTLAEQTIFLKSLLREKLDLVHFLNFNHPLLYTRPFVTTIHDLTMFFFPAGRSSKSKVRQIAFRTVFKRALTMAKKVIAISEYTAHDAAKHLKISHAKIEVIYEGGPQPQEVPFGSLNTIAEFLNTKDPYFLFVSQWRPHKGILTLIDAFADFKSKTGFPHKLVLAGKKTVLEDDVKKKLVESPFSSEIITPGFVQDELLPSLFHHAAAFIMPSEYEGFGLPVLEAMAYGTPPILAHNSSLPEVGGDAALYFETGNVHQLSQAMHDITTDQALYQQLLEKGATQLAKFSWQRCAEQTLQVYLSILEKKR